MGKNSKLKLGSNLLLLMVLLVVLTGSPFAQTQTERTYRFIDGFSTSYDAELIKEVEKKFEEGDSTISGLLFFMYYNTEPYSTDTALLFRTSEEAIKTGSFGMLQLMLTRQFQRRPSDFDAAKRAVLIMGDFGEKRADLWIGAWHLRWRNEPDSSVGYLHAAYKNEIRDAGLLLAELHSDSTTKYYNPQLAVKYLKSDVALGNPQAVLRLGEILIYGEYGIPINTEQAKKYLMFAAENDEVDAAIALGMQALDSANEFEKKSLSNYCIGMNIKIRT